MNPILARWICCAMIYLGLFAPAWIKTVDMRGLTGLKWLFDGAKGESFVLMDTPATIILCSAVDDLMNVTGVALFPDPPKKGTNLTVTINGRLSETLNEGSYLMARVRKGAIKFPQIRFPACDYIKGGCPVAKDVAVIDMMFDIPKFVPGGSYEIEAILYNKEAGVASAIFSRMVKNANNIQTVEDGPRVVCVQGSVEL